MVNMNRRITPIRKKTAARGAGMRRIDAMLKEFVAACKQKFGADLVSIVLFGSYARGTAARYSDVDLLVVIEGLPKDRLLRADTLKDVEMRFIREHRVRIMPLLLEPADFSTNLINPLFYGILTGFKVLYDPRGFMRGFLSELKERIRITAPVYIEGRRRWELAKGI